MAIKYCTHRDLKDVYPNIDEFDSKVPIYGWTEVTDDYWRADNTGLVTKLFADGQELGNSETSAGDVDTQDEWYYDSTTDTTYLFTTNDPNTQLIESGEDFSTIITRYIENASRYLEARLDANIPRKFFKDVDGNYDYVIVRTTAQFATAFAIRSIDPASEVANVIWEEAQMAIAMINDGQTKLSNMVTSDSPEGVLTEIAYSTASTIRPVDTRGQYGGVYDRIQIKITLGGAIGVAKYSIWVRDDTGLKKNKVVTDKVIDGGYQTVAGGLQIRFSAPTVDGSLDIATVDDEWELEVFGRYEKVDSPTVSHRIMTRL